MTKLKSETFLRLAFVLVASLALGLTALKSQCDQNHSQPVLTRAPIDAAICAYQPAPPSGKMGLLTFIKRNRKRWIREILRNPVKWKKMQMKLKKLTQSSQPSEAKGEVQ